MKRLSSLLCLITLALCHHILADVPASGAPRGYWSCTFVGQEWQSLPGGQQQLTPVTYSSKWRSSRQAAYDEALDICEAWTDTSCSFNGCRQKN